MKKISSAAIVIFALFAAAAQAQFTGPPGPFQGFKSTDKEPVEIHADSMKADLGSGWLYFSGHVSAKQGRRIIYAETLDVSYTPEGNISQLEAKGSVKVKMGEDFATADRLVLDNQKRLITLYGKPRVVQGRQIIIGDKIIYEIDNEKIRVTQPRIEWVPEPGPAKPEGADKADKKDRDSEKPAEDKPAPDKGE